MHSKIKQISYQIILFPNFCTHISQRPDINNYRNHITGIAKKTTPIFLDYLLA